MKSVFVVKHSRSLSDGQYANIKFIGAYRSWDTAHAAVERLRSQPGFRDFPRLVNPLVDDDDQGFYIDEYELDKDHWAEGFVSV